ncbi:MAG: NAD-dependent succinate-semialdehyde dehydrogenase [Firmicutes bacterium]|nr:NAD-dependent succinate-semialdehyde dehydrogenase [Bacillota bacterium]
MPEVFGPYVNGRWLVDAGRRSLAVTNPASGEVVGMVREATLEDVDVAFQAAEQAFSSWRRVSPTERGALLHRAAEILERDIEEMSRLLTLEQGKPLVDARKELATTARILHLYAEEATRIEGVSQRGAAGNTFSVAVRQPVGPCALIGPWNYPVELLAFKLGPALAAGCSAVMKPPNETPLTVLRLARCFEAAGAPRGLVNVLVGAGETIGEAMIKHPLARKVAFTGSTAVGRRVASLASAALKPTTLELGGNAPFIVFDDADLELAVAGATRRSYSNAGQICIAVNRVYVQRRVYTEFLDALVARVDRLVVADGLKVPQADMGPVINDRAVAELDERVSDATRKGAKVIRGGRRLTGAEYQRGSFYAPTILTGVDEGMRVMSEESFGPITPVAVFDTPDEVIARANATGYGLAAYVYTRDLNLALRAAEELQCGGVGINVNDVTELSMPFGGWKESGYGRELGRYGLENYLQWKHVRILLPQP